MSPKPKISEPPHEDALSHAFPAPNPELVKHLAIQLLVFARRIDAIEQRLQAELHAAASNGDVARVKAAVADWQRLRDTTNGSK